MINQDNLDLQGWDFTNCDVRTASDVVGSGVTDCIWDQSDQPGGPFTFFTFGVNATDCFVRDCTMSGRKGQDNINPMIRMLGNAAPGDITVALRPAIERNIFLRNSGDPIHLRGRDYVVRRNYGGSLYQFDDGVVLWISGDTYNTGDLVLYGEAISLCQQDGVTSTPFSAGTSGQSNADWAWTNGKPHTDFMQFGYGNGLIEENFIDWRLSSDALLGALFQPNQTFRNVPEQGGNPVIGATAFRSNVSRFPPGLASPYPIQVSTAGQTGPTGPWLFEGNWIYPGSGGGGNYMNAIGDNATTYPLMTWRNNRDDETGVLVPADPLMMV